MSQFKVKDIIQRMGIRHAVQVHHKHDCPQWILDYAKTVKGVCYGASVLRNHQSLVSGDMVIVEEPTMVGIGLVSAYNAKVNVLYQEEVLFNHDGRSERHERYDVSLELFPYMMQDKKAVPVDSYVLLHDGIDSILFYSHSTGLPKREVAMKEDNLFKHKQNKE